MVISSDLYYLIKSMSKQEKIYFKRFSGVQVKGDGNSYIRLFDAIDGMNEYNEATLMKKFAGAKFTKQISVAKNYLYRVILRSLRAYHRPAGKKEEIHRSFEEVGVLFEKRLWGQCRKILRRCRKTAEQYEKYPELVEILIWESKLNYAEGRAVKKELELLNQNYDERKRYLHTLENMYEYDRLEYNFKAVVRMIADKDEKYRKKLKEYLTNPMMKSEELAISTVAKLKYNAVKSSYYYETGEHAESFVYEERQAEILDKNPGIKSERFTDYLVLLSNIMLLCVVLGKYDDFKKYLRKTRGLLGTKEVIKNKFFHSYIIERSYLMEMLYYNKLKEFNTTIKIFDDLHREVTKLGITIRESEEVNLKYLLCAGYFGLKKYDRCLGVLNEILSDKEAEARVTEYLSARMFNIILHYELGNLELAEYETASTQRYVKDKKRLSKFEKLFFQFMNRLVKMKPGVKEARLFDEFKYEIVKLDEKEYKEGIFDRIGIIEWVESKL